MGEEDDKNASRLNIHLEREMISFSDIQAFPTYQATGSSEPEELTPQWLLKAWRAYTLVAPRSLSPLKQGCEVKNLQLLREFNGTALYWGVSLSLILNVFKVKQFQQGLPKTQVFHNYHYLLLQTQSPMS